MYFFMSMPQVKLTTKILCVQATYLCYIPISYHFLVNIFICIILDNISIFNL